MSTFEDVIRTKLNSPDVFQTFEYGGENYILINKKTKYQVFRQTTMRDMTMYVYKESSNWQPSRMQFMSLERLMSCPDYT